MAADLTGTRALVTGGTKGIGRTIATRLLAAGADVIVCARHDPGDLPSHGDATAAFVAGDLRDPDQAAAVVDAAVTRLGGLDLAVNNAGGSPPAAAAESSPRLVEKIVALNLLAPFYVAQRAYHHMAALGGHIVNIGSVAATEPAPGTAAYAAAKAGLTTLTRALALEWGPRVRVNQVTVGLVRTELSAMHYGDSKTMAAIESLIAAGRMATPDDVASACLALAGPDLDYVNGAELRVDGGGQAPAWTLPLRAGEPAAPHPDPPA